MQGFITELGGSKDGYFRRKVYIARDDSFVDSLIQFIDKYQNTDVYYCLYNYENTDIDNCSMIGSPYLDFDTEIETEDDYQRVKREVHMAMQYFNRYFFIPFEMLQVYFSGSKGFHLIVPYEVLGITPDKELNVKFKKLARLVAKECGCSCIDMKIYDRKRLFRIPNSINSKSGLRKVPVTIKQLENFTYKDMKAWAEEERETPFVDPQLIPKSALHYKRLFMLLQPKKKPVVAKKKAVYKIPDKHRRLLPCAKEVLLTGAAKGRRNNTTVALASSLMQSGRTLKEVEEILSEWNQNNNPPLSENELHTTLMSAHHMLSNGKTYGCQTFKDMGLCVGKKCELNS